MRQVRPDHTLIALRGAEEADWQERGLVDKVRARFGLPLTVLEIGREGRVPAPEHR